MKYVVILGDGMSDYPQKELNNKTPLELAKKPFIDGLSKRALIGKCATVPSGMKPGSDVANLSVLGYNVKECYTGRSPLEAASIGIKLKETDVTLRANLVTVSNEEIYEDKTMIDYSAGEISTKEAGELIAFLKEHLDTEEYKLFAGISYRHCLVIDNGTLINELTPPHDITGKAVKGHLPTSKTGLKYLDLMKKSYELLKDHPINLERVKNGKNPANSLWFWGEGTKPNLQNFKERYGLKGGMISAVDLLKGIAKINGMEVIEVEGATGNYDTNFAGKAEACVNALKGGLDFVYVHMEAPDECGHHGDAKNKIYSIEKIDEVVARVYNGLKETGEDFRILICPDHPTPLNIKTHASDAVPFIIYDSREIYSSSENGYTEQNAENAGLKVDSGEELIKLFLQK